MGGTPDAWEDEWSNAADSQLTPSAGPEPDQKKVTGKVSKAQRRAQQAEFNRQLWEEAQGPKETNFYHDTRNAVPHRSEFKPRPILLSRKGPIVQSSQPPTHGLQGLSLSSDGKHSDGRAESSDDEDEIKAREITLAERQAQAARDRIEKQRKYDERRQELFGAPKNSSHSLAPQSSNGKSGGSSPGSLTPPGSRSGTPTQGRGGRGGRRSTANTSGRTQSRGSQHRDLYDPSYVARPDSAFVSRQTDPSSSPTTAGLSRTAPTSSRQQQPIRAPTGPDPTGRGGFGVALRRAVQPNAADARPANAAPDHSAA